MSLLARVRPDLAARYPAPPKAAPPKPPIDERPEWVRRAADGKLPAKAWPVA